MRGRGLSRSYQASTSGFRSQTTAISGRTPMSARWTQRAAALANSRPINPPPTTPKRMIRSAIQHRKCFDCRGTVVYDRHQRAGHRRGVFVLDDVPPVDDAGGAEADHHLGPAEDLLVGCASAAADEHGYGAGHLQHTGIVIE